jgi:integrase
MQRGTIIKHHGSWALRYYDTEVQNGVRVGKKVFKKLVPISPKYPSKRSVELLAWKILEPVNTQRIQPESSMPVSDFIENIYLPSVKETLRPSTHKDYKRDCYECHIKSRLNGLRLRDFRTVIGQKLIQDIAKSNPLIGHKTLVRLKSFLSGAFRHAKAKGILDEQNPMRDVTLPENVPRRKFQGDTHTVPEIIKMMEYLSASPVAFACVATAAFTGLRLAELRGLQWGDFAGQSLKVSRTVWRTQERKTKNESSEASVPVLPQLGFILQNYRYHLEGLPEEGNLGKTVKENDWMFAGEKRATSLNLANLVRRVINPLLTRCTVCGKGEHDAKEHAFQLDESIPKFKGWHSFRRSLASNLSTLGIKPKVVQAILRHGDIGTTLSYYMETPEADSRDALDQLAKLIKQPACESSA